MATVPKEGTASKEASQAVEFIRKIRERVATVVVGQDVVVERTLIALFTGGHLLLQGARSGQDVAGEFDRRTVRSKLQPHPVHAGPDARGHYGYRNSRRHR